MYLPSPFPFGNLLRKQGVSVPFGGIRAANMPPLCISSSENLPGRIISLGIPTAINDLFFLPSPNNIHEINNAIDTRYNDVSQPLLVCICKSWFFIYISHMEEAIYKISRGLQKLIQSVIKGFSINLFSVVRSFTSCQLLLCLSMSWVFYITNSQGMTSKLILHTIAIFYFHPTLKMLKVLKPYF